MVLGGHEGDTITVSDLGNLVTDDHNIVLGDNGFVDWIDETDALDSSADIDEIASTTTTGAGGIDTINSGFGDDIVIGGRFGDDIDVRDGDNVVVGNSGQLLAAPDDVQQLGGQPMTIGVITTIEPGDGGDDHIVTGLGEDIVLGGMANDTISTGASNDIVLGDNGFLDYVITDSDSSALDLITTTNPNEGGDDVIDSGAGNDMVLAGSVDDVVTAGSGNDLIFGDHGKIEGDIDADLLPLNMPVVSHPFSWTSIDTQTSDTGGVDLIRGNSGQDVILGGQRGDFITGGSEDDDIIGGRNVAGGHDSGDFIDAGSENYVVAGDNAEILRRGDSLSLRMRVLSGDEVFDGDGNALVTADRQVNPTGAREREIVLFDHSFTPLADTSGNDVIAGGSNDDVIFGQLGDDWIQGDGSAIDDDGAMTIDVVGTRESVEDIDGVGTDGDDYIEGNGGQDTIFGNLGQDDIVGGSSDLYSLTSPDLRPDGEDTIFGGAGTWLLRNDPGDLTGQGHARDADTILGDNGNIFRLVGTNDAPLAPAAFLTFNHDIHDTDLRIIPRAYQLLDYTQGGDAGDLGAADLLHGEAGDDTIHGMTGNDVAFGEGQDDDLYGGTGYDRLYGGTGSDGILGDDGKILTSRNGLTEPLNRLTVANDEVLLETNGPFIGVLEGNAGMLKKAVDLAGFESGGNDIIFGGVGDDFLHGGAGDDAILGAEALREFYNEDPQRDDGLSTQWTVQLQQGIENPLAHDPATGKLAAYDADDPRRRILFEDDGSLAKDGTGTEFFLNFDEFILDEMTGVAVDTGGGQIVSDDGKDRLFGDLGNDWLVGGTNFDRMFGGMGNDQLNADDNHANGTAPGLNDVPDDANFAHGDFVFGGGGLDVLIGNTGNDRLFDWSGEFNSFILPYSPFGAPTVNRMLSPAIQDFLLDLGFVSGADQTVGEPDGELGVVTQSDPQWGDQHGGPRDPRPGNTGGTGRDTQGAPEFSWLPAVLTPDIDIEKFTNGEDADRATGPELSTGSTATFTYVVRNVGERALTDVDVVDDNSTPENAGDDFSPVFVDGDTNGDGVLDIGEAWTYTASHVVTAGQYTNVAVATAIGSGIPVSGQDASNHFGLTIGPRIDIEKATNGVDADEPTGPLVSIGDTVTFSYVVRNTGDEALSNVVVVDDNGTVADTGDDFAPAFVGGDADGDGLLDPGETWTYTASRVVTAGQYVNVAAATGSAGAVEVTDADASHHFGRLAGPAVDIEKATNGQDADVPTGPQILIGDLATFSYVVTNVGDTALAGVRVVDDAGTPGDASDDFNPLFVGGDVDFDGLLDIGETWNYTASHVVTAGLHANLATVTVTATDDGSVVADTDASHHFGRVPDFAGVDLEKATNGEDADQPTGPLLAAGGTAAFEYVLRNTGNVTLVDVTLTDDNGTADNAADFIPAFIGGDTDGDGELDPDEVWTYTAAHTVTPGQYVNVATVTASGAGTVVTDSDASHHFGRAAGASVDIEKATNGIDADSPTGPIIAAGDTAVFTYLVRNLGGVALSHVTVVDDNGTSGASDDFAPSFVGGDSNANGLLDLDETWEYTASRVVTAGQYANVATVTAMGDGSTVAVADTDASHHLGVTQGARIEKATNALDPLNPTAQEDADSAPGQLLAVGSDVVWTYQVFNEGEVALDLVEITDDAGTPGDAADDFSPVVVAGGDANLNGLLDPGEVWLFTSAGIVDHQAVLGLYGNVATVSAVGFATGSASTDQDASYHSGVFSASINLEKLVQEFVLAENIEGRMTGGGSVFTDDGVRVSHGFELHCNPVIGPNTLQINFEGNSFHMETLVSATCLETELDQSPGPLKNAPFDTYIGVGEGRYNGESGYTVEFLFTDGGEPGTNDWMEFTLTDPSGAVVISAANFLDRGTIRRIARTRRSTRQMAAWW